MRQPQKRFSGKVLAISIALFLPLAAITLVAVWFSASEPDGEVLVSARGEAGTVSLRRGFRERGYVDLVAEDTTGERLWHEVLFGLQDEVIAVAGDLVLVRVTNARGYPAVYAYSFSRGELVWRFLLPEGSEPGAAPSLFVENEEIIVVDEEQRLVLSLAGERLDAPAGDAREVGQLQESPQ